jgi:hypothetical protein
MVFVRYWNGKYISQCCTPTFIYISQTFESFRVTSLKVSQNKEFISGEHVINIASKYVNSNLLWLTDEVLKSGSLSC